MKRFVIVFSILLVVLSPVMAFSYEMPFPKYISCKTESMYPLTCKDKLYGVIPTWEEKQSIRPGTIVMYDLRAFEHKGTWVFDSARFYGYSWVIHRVIGRCKDGYVLKGDNNPREDDICVKPAQIMFVVTRTKKH